MTRCFPLGKFAILGFVNKSREYGLVSEFHREMTAQRDFRSKKYRYEKKLWQSDTINRGHRLSSSRIKAKNVNNK